MLHWTSRTPTSMLRRLLWSGVGKRPPSLSFIRLKSTTAAESPRQNPQGGGGFYHSVGTYFRSGGREDLSAIGVGFGGLAVAATALNYFVGSMQSSHEKIGVLTANLEKERELRAKDAAILTANLEKERELRAKDIEKERELRDKDIGKERELRVEGIGKERELRDKDATIMKAERAVIESELRSVKLQLENARCK